MEKRNGFQYLVEGHKELDKFAKGILALVNVKSIDGTVVDIRTFKDCTTVRVTTTIELDGLISNFLGEITEKESIEIVQIEFDDLKQNKRKVINNIDDEDKSYFVTARNADF